MTVFGNLSASWRGSQLVPFFSWLVLCSCQNTSSRGFRLGSLIRRDLTSQITYGKLALTCFCAVEYGKGWKISRWNLRWGGLWKRQQPQRSRRPWAEEGAHRLETGRVGIQSSRCEEAASKSAAESDLPGLFPRGQPPSARELLRPCLTPAMFLRQWQLAALVYLPNDMLPVQYTWLKPRCMHVYG